MGGGGDGGGRRFDGIAGETTQDETGESDRTQVMMERQRSVPVPVPVPVPGIASRLRPALPPKVPDPSLPACRGPRFMGEERRPTRDVESGSERRGLGMPEGRRR